MSLIKNRYVQIIAIHAVELAIALYIGTFLKVW